MEGESSSNQIRGDTMTQHDTVLKMLRLGSITTKDMFENWIMAPQKVIQKLRKKGYIILTEPVKGKKYCKYTLLEQQE